MNSLTTILNPGILFFILGFVAALLRSNLTIPESVIKFLSLYLMLSIGFKGGVSLYHSSLFGDGLIILGIIILMSALVPVILFFALRKEHGVADAAAIGATYGSNSTLTYITAAGFLTSSGIAFGGYMTVALVVMETPAIILALILARHYQGQVAPQAEPIRRIIHGALTDGTIVLLVGSLAIGYLLTALGTVDSPLASFIGGDFFTGMLVFFLLYMGLTVGHKIRTLESFPLSLLAVGIGVPLINGLVAIGLALVFRFQPGDAFLLAILCASASYIVAPAILQEALPEANPGKYLTMSLGVTFPFNIVLGIPLFWWIIQALLG